MLLLPLYVLLDWNTFIKRRAGTIEGELAKASHGAALVVLPAIIGYFLYQERALNVWALGALALTGIFGAGWLSTAYALVPRARRWCLEPDRIIFPFLSE
jgi:hypothetical protein